MYITTEEEGKSEKISPTADRFGNMGMWLSGRAFALHVKGPGFDPRRLHFRYKTSFRVPFELPITLSFFSTE